MSELEKDLSCLKGKPVTVLRDRSKTLKGKPLFLEHNSSFPECRDLSMLKTMKVESVLECNGFCGKHEVNSL